MVNATLVVSNIRNSNVSPCYHLSYSLYSNSIILMFHTIIEGHSFEFEFRKVSISTKHTIININIIN